MTEWTSGMFFLLATRWLANEWRDGAVICPAQRQIRAQRPARKETAHFTTVSHVHSNWIRHMGRQVNPAAMDLFEGTYLQENALVTDRMGSKAAPRSASGSRQDLEQPFILRRFFSFYPGSFALLSSVADKGFLLSI